MALLSEIFQDVLDLHFVLGHNSDFLDVQRYRGSSLGLYLTVESVLWAITDVLRLRWQLMACLIPVVAAIVWTSYGLHIRLQLLSRVDDPLLIIYVVLGLSWLLLVWATNLLHLLLLCHYVGLLRMTDVIRLRKVRHTHVVCVHHSVYTARMLPLLEYLGLILRKESLVVLLLLLLMVSDVMLILLLLEVKLFFLLAAELKAQDLLVVNLVC